MPLTTLKRIANTLLAPAGLELHRRGAEAYCRGLAQRLETEAGAWFRLESLWLGGPRPQTVIDVGASVGEFSRQVRVLLPGATIYAFEPLPQSFRAIQEAFADDSRFHAFAVGLADTGGELVFESNDFPPCSSFLKMTGAHADAFPFTANTSQISVRVDTLDHAAESLVLLPPVLLKIDVQGYEDRVLRGAEETAGMASVVLVETSFVELYERQPLFDDIYSLLRSWGFAYHGSIYQVRDPRTGKALQEDSVFVRP